MGITYSQFYPPPPSLTASNLPSQIGKVFIVTGGASGVGKELCRILHGAGGTVYIAGRSAANTQLAIDEIKSGAASGTTQGELKFLFVSLDDLSTIKTAVETFTKAETRLDVLFNNAGVSLPPNTPSAQHHDMQMATNCLGPHLLTQLLLPILESTARSLQQPGAVRVVWTSSIVVDMQAPKGGMRQGDLAGSEDGSLPAGSSTSKASSQLQYAITKVGNWFLASELAKEVHDKGILSVTQNPGNLSTPLTRHLPRLVVLMVSPLLHKAQMGAYTELWAGLSSELTINDGGAYVIPWGRKHPAPRVDLLDALKTMEEGGTGQARAFKEYCDKHVASFR